MHNLKKLSPFWNQIYFIWCTHFWDFMPTHIELENNNQMNPVYNSIRIECDISVNVYVCNADHATIHLIAQLNAKRWTLRQAFGQNIYSTCPCHTSFNRLCTHISVWFYEHEMRTQLSNSIRKLTIGNRSGPKSIFSARFIPTQIRTIKFTLANSLLFSRIYLKVKWLLPLIQRWAIY